MRRAGSARTTRRPLCAFGAPLAHALARALALTLTPALALGALPLQVRFFREQQAHPAARDGGGRRPLAPPRTPGCVRQGAVQDSLDQSVGVEGRLAGAHVEDEVTRHAPANSALPLGDGPDVSDGAVD
eukprot:9667343-Lingulodinium_polyedra.AAC.1